jgi:hypothetical protein
VDKGFVAQVAAVIGGRQGKLNKVQQVEADKKVPLEVQADVKHTEGVSRIPQPLERTKYSTLGRHTAVLVDGMHCCFSKECNNRGPCNLWVHGSLAVAGACRSPLCTTTICVFC